MRFRISLLGAVLLGLAFAALLACVTAWFVLLTNICSNPRVANPATLNTIPYSCHGATVFITPVQEDLLHWLGPAGLGLIVIMGVIVAASIIRGVQAAMGSVRIIDVPPGEAPLEIRKAWVGLVLPLAGNRVQARKLPIAGVLTGPKNLFASLLRVFGGQRSFSTGYAVETRAAIDILEKADPRAAAWWRENAPHLLAPWRHFVFAAECCELVVPDDLMSKRGEPPR